MFAPNLGGSIGSGEAATTLENHRRHHWPPAAAEGAECNLFRVEGGGLS